MWNLGKIRFKNQHLTTKFDKSQANFSEIFENFPNPVRISKNHPPNPDDEVLAIWAWLG